MNNRKPAATPEPTPPPKTPTQIALELAREQLRYATDGRYATDVQQRVAFALEVAKAATNLASVELAVASARLEHREDAISKREQVLKAGKS